MYRRIEELEASLRLEAERCQSKVEDAHSRLTEMRTQLDTNLNYKLI